MNPTLSIGARGPAVVVLQTALNKAMPALPPLVPDGAFGPATRSRVVEFQRSRRLSPDGVVGPNTWAALGSAAVGGPPVPPGFPPPPAPPGQTPAPPAPPSPAAGNGAGAKIAAVALKEYQNFGWFGNTAFNPSNPRIAGKRCSDSVTRKRQGGEHLREIFSIAGGPAADRCLTLSKQAEAMYGRSYSASERNNTDIVSWCGIFALYCAKQAGLRLSGWPLKYSIGKAKPTDEWRVRGPGEAPEPGDIGIIHPMAENHHFVVTQVAGTTISSIDGNSGMLMEITQKNGGYSAQQVRGSGGGFLAPIWERVL
ncbi:MAG: peptidoglycan-binding protein [Bryobacteraceae bacterium]|nr:peptidoglycan-binding protein [Bryobacteraceae bacterium]